MYRIELAVENDSVLYGCSRDTCYEIEVNKLDALHDVRRNALPRHTIVVASLLPSHRILVSHSYYLLPKYDTKRKPYPTYSPTDLSSRVPFAIQQSKISNSAIRVQYRILFLISDSWYTPNTLISVFNALRLVV